MSKAIERVEMLNVNKPANVVRVDKAKYDAMKAAILAVTPAATPGMTVAEIKAALLARLPEDLFPGGAKAGWWLKGVQLDLEARGMIARENSKPLRLHRV